MKYKTTCDIVNCVLGLGLSQLAQVLETFNIEVTFEQDGYLRS